MDSLKIIKAQKQYLNDSNGLDYLDCTFSNAHIGHCHPRVVVAAQYQMRKVETSQGFIAGNVYSFYVKALLSTFPEELCACFLVNSRSEANDLAIRLAKTFTKHRGFVAFEKSDFGSFSSLLELSQDVSASQPPGKYVEIAHLPLPTCTSEVHENYDETRTKILNHFKNGKLAGFISEMVLLNNGGMFLPQEYLKSIYEIIRSFGGVCIADESYSGLGRLGRTFWGFQYYDVVPEIVTVGEILGNGFPMAAVVTTKQIANNFGEFVSTFGGNPLACAIGYSVLEIIENEKLMMSGSAVGFTLMQGLQELKAEFTCIDAIWGMCLCIGISFIEDKNVHLTPSKLAQSIQSSLLTKYRILVQLAGPLKDVIALTPPMCFTQQNARTLIDALRNIFESLYSSYRNTASGCSSNKRFFVQIQPENEAGCSLKKSKSSYEDID